MPCVCCFIKLISKTRQKDAGTFRRLPDFFQSLKIYLCKRILYYRTVRIPPIRNQNNMRVSICSCIDNQYYIILLSIPLNHNSPLLNTIAHSSTCIQHNHSIACRDQQTSYKLSLLLKELALIANSLEQVSTIAQKSVGSNSSPKSSQCTNMNGSTKTFHHHLSTSFSPNLFYTS